MKALDDLVARLAPLVADVGYPVYVVGGAVRDALLGRGSVDIDLAVDGPLEGLAALMGGAVIRHERFETATVRVGELTYDLARTRSETYATPGALPLVAPSPIGEDLERRDFTVNALAVGLNGPDVGVLTAAPGAVADLEDRQLRVLHRGSFIDDPTRLLRAVRYAERLGFQIEDGTRSLFDEAVAAGALATVSGSRVGNELRLLLAEADPVAAVAAFSAAGLGEALCKNFGLHGIALAQRAVTLLPDDGRVDLLALAAAGTEVGEDDLRRLLDDLAFNAADRDVVVTAATRAAKLSLRLEMAGPPSEIDAAVARAGGGLELVALAGAIGPTTVAREWLAELRHRQLVISGEDLLAAGARPGPGIGAGLASARAAMLDGEAEDRDDQLAAALAAAG